LAALDPFRMKRQPQALRLGEKVKGFLATKTLIGSASQRFALWHACASKQTAGASVPALFPVAA
jgi:hypothetical protein